MIHIVAALPCEAKPLIHHYKLNGKPAQHGFRVYENNEIRLIISGLGKIACAAASAYLQGISGDTESAWLNIGVAGHQHLAVGEILLASKITDTATQQSWYPPLTFRTQIQRLPVVTVDQPNTDYSPRHAYDMEAAGFYATACRFNSQELIQICKIISDNQAQPATEVTPQQVESLIKARMDDIDLLVQALQKQHTKSITGHIIDAAPFLSQWHFTVAQQHQLQRLLQRWQARTGSTPLPKEMNDFRNSKQVIQYLTQQLNGQALRFEDNT